MTRKRITLLALIVFLSTIGAYFAFRQPAHNESRIAKSVGHGSAVSTDSPLPEPIYHLHVEKSAYCFDIGGNLYISTWWNIDEETIAFRRRQYASIDTPVVYYFGEPDFLLRRLDRESSALVLESWPFPSEKPNRIGRYSSGGWINGQYRAFRNWRQDSPDISSRYPTTLSRNGAILREIPAHTADNPSYRADHDDVFVSISRREDYLVYIDNASHQVVIMFLPSLRQKVVPANIISPMTDTGLSKLTYWKYMIVATDSGIYWPAGGRIVNPVTLKVTEVGRDKVRFTALPDQMGEYRFSPDGSLFYKRNPRVGAHYSASVDVFDTSSARSIPTWWFNTDEYPRSYSR